MVVSKNSYNFNPLLAAKWLLNLYKNMANTKGGEMTEVHLWVDKQQWPYIKRKPLHGSQRIVQEHEDGSAEIIINVIPNFELESRILGQGMHMKVLSPESFKEKIKNQIQSAAGTIY